ncbi:TPA: DUF4376 domain-containing protein [Salmonella enterica subsp. houtenae]|nr:DUF4376 domain-containing protein [Salmonella enterica subsp. houtenae]
MVAIMNARNGRYNENGTISAEVQFSDIDRYLPYTAAEHDPADYGKQLYADLVAGKYGAVAPFIVTPEILQAAKDRKHADIKSWRDEQENGDYLFSYDGRNWDYGKSTRDRMSISLAMAKRNALPEGFAWTDGDNNIVPMDNAGLIALAAAIEQAMFDKGMQINLRQLQMKAEVQALTTPDDVRHYRIDWPQPA